MMRRAPLGNSIDHATAAGSLLLRMRAWFARGAMAHIAQVEPNDAGQDDFGANNIVAYGPSPAATQTGEQPTAMLLPFPIHGEALLVKLADQLRSKIAASAPGCDEGARATFLLTLSRRPCVRLTIDAAAYVEFHAGPAIYHLVIELVQDTTIAIQTSDFDTVVKFVAQYVTDRLSDAHIDAGVDASVMEVPS